MKMFRVGITFGEGFFIEVQASSKQEAEQKAFDMVDEKSSDVVRKSFFVADCKEMH